MSTVTGMKSILILLAAVVIVVTATVCLRMTASPAAQAQRWEYGFCMDGQRWMDSTHAVRAKDLGELQQKLGGASDQVMLVQFFNFMGKQGWEFVAVDNDLKSYVFRRPAP